MPFRNQKRAGEWKYSIIKNMPTLNCERTSDEEKKLYEWKTDGKSEEKMSENLSTMEHL